MPIKNTNNRKVKSVINIGTIILVLCRSNAWLLQLQLFLYFLNNPNIMILMLSNLQINI